MNPRIDQIIALTVVEPQTLLIPVTKEIIADLASGGMCVNSNLWQVIQKGISRSTPGDIGHAVSVKHAPYPVLIGIVATSPPCDLNRSLQVANKQQYTSPTLVGNAQKLDTVVDRQLPNDMEGN